MYTGLAFLESQAGSSMVAPGAWTCDAAARHFTMIVKVTLQTDVLPDINPQVAE